MNEKNLEEWREQVKREIALWRADQNYIPILSVPLTQDDVEKFDE